MDERPCLSCNVLWGTKILKRIKARPKPSIWQKSAQHGTLMMVAMICLFSCLIPQMCEAEGTRKGFISVGPSVVTDNQTRIQSVL